MKRVYIAIVVALVGAAGACGLNPQPIPPDTNDAALGPSDASKQSNDASPSDAAGGIPDVGTDSEPVPESDAGSDADASDALIDVAVDAPLDAIDDVVLDVTVD